jgi:TolB protein
MRPWLLLPLLAVAPAHAIELVRANASESAVRGDGAVAFVERHGGQVRLAWRDAAGVVREIETTGTPDTPAWSPSGDAIAYATMEGENSNLVVLDLATGRTKYVAPTSDSEMHPFFAPGGGKLVYTRLVSQGDADAELRLFEFDLRPGGADVPLLRGAPASYGSWSPDGQWLLYWRFVDGSNAEIAVSRADGSERRALTNDPAFDGWPSWSPDGRFVAFARERGEEADILIVPFAGGDACLVAAGAGRKTSPKWSADGRAIVFDRRFGGKTDLLRSDVPAGCITRAR